MAISRAVREAFCSGGRSSDLRRLNMKKARRLRRAFPDRESSKIAIAERNEPPTGAAKYNSYFGTLKIAIRLPPMFIVSIKDPTKTFLFFLFIKRQGPLVIRSPRVARLPSYVIVVFFAFFICVLPML
jgi:hypothetical protein